jgi:protease I
MRLPALILALAGTIAAADRPQVLMPIADGFNTTEFYPTWHGLRAAGYEVTVVAPTAGDVTTGKHVFRGAAAAETASSRTWFAIAQAGGDGPKLLEQVPPVLEAYRQAFAAGRPVAAICHGPRIAASLGLLDHRVTTSLYSVKDEVPERWNRGGFGSYIDRQVVRDGNLVTSRYPEDVTLFLRATLKLFADGGGLPVESGLRRILIINPMVTGETQFAVLRTLPALLPEVTTVREWQLTEVLKEGDLGKAYDAAVLLDGARTERLAGNAQLAAIVGQLAAAQRPILAQPGMAQAIGAVASEALPAAGADLDLNQALLETLLTRLRQVPPRESQAPAVRPQSFIALPPGFDDRVVATLQAVLDSRGFQVTTLSATVGWQRGLNGIPVEATSTYAAWPVPATGAVVVAPGGFAPGKPDPARIAWLVSAYANGATLVTAGTDSRAVGGNPVFAGLRLAGSHQFRWSYPQDGGKHADDDALRSADRLVTIQGADQLGAGLRLLEPLLAR